jgi:hypothetical protein
MTSILERLFSASLSTQAIITARCALRCPPLTRWKAEIKLSPSFEHFGWEYLSSERSYHEHHRLDEYACHVIKPAAWVYQCTFGIQS